METTKLAPSQMLRDFVESKLGFGQPITGATLETLFSDNPVVYHYSNDYGQGLVGSASINAVNRMQWEGMHHTESGEVLHDLYTNPQGRVLDFLQKQANRQGFTITTALNDRQRENLMVINDLMRSFRDDYRKEVDTAAEFLSTMTLRKVEGQHLNWDLIIRVGLFGENEAMYVQFVIASIIHGKAFLITDHQVADTCQAVRDFFASFEQTGQLFDDLPHVALSRMLVHHLLHKRDVTAETMWNIYHSTLKANAETVTGWQKVRPWVQMTKTETDILTSAFLIIRTYLHTHIVVNAAKAVE